MDIKLILISFGAALLAGFIHGALGMGFGMIAMATMTLFVPYNNAAAIVSVALLMLIVQMIFSLREHIDLKESLAPSLALTVGKIIGIFLMMSVQAAWLRIALGLFLIVYSASQLLNIKSMRISGTPMQGLIFCFMGGFFGGVFNVSGPAVSIYCQAKYPDDPRRYAANMNFIFLPSAVIAPLMHLYYGNFGSGAGLGSLSMVLGVLIATAAGVAVLKKINAEKMRRLSCIYVLLMGIVICISG